VEYGEAQAVILNGRRAWRWVAEPPAEAVASPTVNLVHAG